MACEPISFLSLKSSHSFHWEFVYSVSKIGAYTVPGTVLGPENTRTDKIKWLSRRTQSSPAPTNTAKIHIYVEQCSLKTS